MHGGYLPSSSDGHKFRSVLSLRLSGSHIHGPTAGRTGRGRSFSTNCLADRPPPSEGRTSEVPEGAIPPPFPGGSSQGSDLPAMGRARCPRCGDPPSGAAGDGRSLPRLRRRYGAPWRRPGAGPQGQRRPLAVAAGQGGPAPEAAPIAVLGHGAAWGPDHGCGAVW